MSIKTFREMQRQVLRRISNMDFSTTNDNDLLPKVKDWLNSRYNEIIRFRPWDETIFSQTLTLTSGTSEYCLNRKTDKIWSIFDATNGKIIDMIDISQHTRLNAVPFDVVGNVYKDSPVQCYPIGTKTVQAKTGSAAEKISVVSSSASDVTPTVVFVKGEVSGVEVSESIVLTGTTAAQSSNTYDASQYLTISVGTNSGAEATVYGVITVSGVTSSNVIAKLTNYEKVANYKWLKFTPEPNATISVTIWANSKCQPLVNDNDVPILDCSDELIYGAYADALREDGQEQEAALADSKFVQMVTALWASTKDTKKFVQMYPATGDRYIYADFGRTIFLR